MGPLEEGGGGNRISKERDQSSGSNVERPTHSILRLSPKESEGTLTSKTATVEPESSLGPFHSTTPSLQLSNEMTMEQRLSIVPDQNPESPPASQESCDPQHPDITGGRSSSTIKAETPLPLSDSDQSDNSVWSTVSRQSQDSASTTMSPRSWLSFPPSARPPFWWLPSSSSLSSRYLHPYEDRYFADVASSSGGGLRMRRVLQAVMHGVVLALQGLVALAVLSVFVWITLWKNDDSEPAFWAWLWEIPSPALASILILCFVTMVAHELRVLSAVTLLYLQAAILALTTVTVMMLWISCVEQDSIVVKGILVGCSVFMWGIAALGFLRAAVIWKVESLEEDEAYERLLPRDGAMYGTLPSSG